ncbi:DUF3352 domain-containing protein [Gramella sp. MAR_2010_147]|uniref:DUF3352 domain-containing protein n=1 Tax=Gramella sp. MAR_2010_147 TaxID=1250205 RepID=UPI00087D863C|nr:DUF3352 domain-containing protein [Gramella sp. MAR_2010_147]SDS52488.1 Protein of unknown function [Gramella sp. MAR_2010_147]
MKRFIVFITILFVFACSENQEPEFNSITFIPEDAEAIAHTADLKQFIRDLSNNEFYKESDFGFKQKLSSELKFTKYLNFRHETGINISNIASEKLIYTITTKIDSAFIPLDSIKNKSVETLSQDGVDFQRIILEENSFYFYETGNSSILSNSKNKILDIANGRNLLKSASLKNAFNASDPNKTSIFLKNSAINKLSGFFENFNFPGFKNFSDWIVLDLDIEESEIKVNGIGVFNKSDHFLNIFSDTNPKEIEIGKVCPQDFLSFYSFSFSSFEKLENNLNKITKDSVNREFPSILNHVREIGSIQLKEGDLFVLNAVEIESVKTSLAGMGEETETYRDIPIYQLENSGIFKKVLPELMLLNENRFYTIIDHFIVFADKPDLIKKAITDFQNSNTIAGKSYYSEMLSSLSSESSILIAGRLPEFSKSIKSSDSEKLNFRKNSLAAFQIIGEDNFAHLHGIFSDSKDQNPNGNSAAQIASFKLDAPMTRTPYFFKNHETDQMDIAVQDENNMLYLISNKGNVFWKKKLDSQITSDIYEVDLFKNGNKQLAFSTGYHLEILDRNGNSVKPFPIKFNQALTQPLSVFDYDNNRTYRFVLTQGKRVYMLGPKGKSIKGFDFENAKTEIVKQPKHIRLGTKDYILVSEESGRLNILSRQGSIRVPVNENFNYSENEWYGNEGNFISSGVDSNLISVTQSGTVSRKNLEFADNHRLVANDDFLVYLNENELTINETRVTLDFGLYTDPQLFEIGKRSLIAITDLQAQKVFVFDQNAELLPGFPVYGTSEVDISNADIDSRLELLVKGDENEILLYKL